MSLLEVLVVVSVIGILVMFAAPSISGIRDTASEMRDKANAKHVDNISQALAAMGVAHVIPESLGGIKATIRLLREGVIVSQGPFAGQVFMIRPLSDHEVEGAAVYLQLLYDDDEIRLTYIGGE